METHWTIFTGWAEIARIFMTFASAAFAIAFVVTNRLNDQGDEYSNEL